ncbi:MAG: ATP-binding protein [Smithellaceae bacterium]|nr:ATP-binding protein [Smithellaceae bacterium]
MRQSLIFKLTIITSLILAIFMFIFAYMNIETMNRHVVEKATSNADRITDTIIKTTHYEMLKVTKSQVYLMIDEVGKQEDIEKIRMINKDGVIIHSTNRGEIGAKMSKQAETCNMCHVGDTPLIHASTMDRGRIFKDPGGKKVLGMTKAIYNHPSCYTASCHAHPAGTRVLGMLDVIFSLEKETAEITALRNKTIYLTIILLLLTGTLITAFTQRIINWPIKALLEHARRVGEGDLDSKIDSDSKDELGKLAGTFDSMTDSLKKARRELEDWGRNLESKVEERTQEIRNMQDQLIRTEKMASVGQLAAGVAHEINNPLTSIHMYTTLLRDNERLDPALQSDISVIATETQRCARIVKGLLEFSREHIPQMLPCSINDIMKKTMDLIEKQFSSADMEIRSRLDEGIPKIYADANQLEQVFINILINSYQAMTEGGILTVASGLLADEALIYMEISDTGCGIPEEHLNKIFNPFFTTKEHRGTGLGMAISYGIIENHQGRIEVKSKVGAGTTVTVCLPLCRPVGAGPKT